MPPRSYLLSDLAQRLKGVVIGDPKTSITSLCSLDEPIDGGLSFCRVERAYTVKNLVKQKKLSAVLASSKIEAAELEGNGNFLLVSDPYEALVSLIPLFHEPAPRTAGISEKADIHPSAKIGKNSSIGAFSVIGEGVTIGNDCVIYSHVVIYPKAIIGDRTILHSGCTIREFCTVGSDAVVQNGAVLGADGFGYVPDPKLGLKAIPQIGTAKLSDRVEVGANSCIDRGTLGTTSVGPGSKIDNNVQIGHNVKIGSHSIVCGQTGIAGSVTIGNGSVIGGSVGIADHIKIGDGVRIGGKSGVDADLPEKGDYVGFPILPASTWRRNSVLLRDLASVLAKLKRATKE